jgi:hypothetical protein
LFSSSHCYSAGLCSLVIWPFSLLLTGHGLQEEVAEFRHNWVKLNDEQPPKSIFAKLSMIQSYKISQFYYILYFNTFPKLQKNGGEP